MRGGSQSVRGPSLDDARPSPRAGVYRLSFRLPAALVLSAPIGRHCPCLHGCLLVVGRDGRVEVTGPSRERLFDQAARFLRVVSKGHAAQCIAAVLESPAGYVPPGRDGWAITVNADVSFAPTSLETQIPKIPANCRIERNGPVADDGLEELLGP